MSRRSLWAAVVSMLVVVVVLTLSLSRHGPRAQPTDAGLVGHVGPVARSCQGVAVTATDNVQRVIDSHPPGTTFCLSAGTYRLVTPLVPKRGDVLVGHQGAVLSGSKVLTGWRTDGRVWSATGFLPPSPGSHGECASSVPTCSYTEDVFLDKRRLQRVSSPSAVTAGTVYADYRTNTITIGDDPRSHLIEQAVAPSLIRATVDDVTVANLVVEQAANRAQVGAIENRHPYAAGSGWRILDNEVRLNHGVGIGFADASTVTGNFIHDQGQLGFGAGGSGSVVSNNEISFNGEAGYSAGWEAGGSKSWKTERHTLTHNYVHDNMGPGLWADGGNIDTTYEYNKIVDNWCAGITHEISYDATISLALSPGGAVKGVSKD
jgi:parallel beta helix pectate lyase-like protein